MKHSGQRNTLRGHRVTCHAGTGGLLELGCRVMYVVWYKSSVWKDVKVFLL